MEKWERVQKPPARRGYDYPSFSSTLLDSIYRSIDDETNRETARDNLYRGAPDPKKKQSSVIDTKCCAPVTRLKGDRGATRENRPGGTPDPSLSLSSSSKKYTVAVSEKPVTRLQHFHSTTSSSSECSSYGGFSSSEAEPAAVHSNRLKPIRTPAFADEIIRSDPCRPPRPPLPEKNKKNLSSIRSKFRDLRKSRSPASPGARLASFLNSLFTTATGNHKKPKAGGGGGAGEESACSTASSYSRSCLTKTPSLSSAADNGVKRSVRFELPAAAVRRREGKKMMLRDYEDEEEEEEDDDVESDSSSDLFELENLTAVGRYQDELPVYETTNFGMNRAIAKGLIL